jgi:dihydroflavonol-4-reductase
LIIYAVLMPTSVSAFFLNYLASGIVSVYDQIVRLVHARAYSDLQMRIPMKTLVTGAAGHIGAALVRLLLAQNRQVRAAIHTDSRALEDLEVEKTFCDLGDEQSVVRALESVDVVYHCAARIAISKKDERGMVETNVGGTRRLTEAALKKDVRRFVHFSSIHAIAPATDGASVDELCQLVDHQTGMAYDASKAEAERIVLAAVPRGLAAVIVNPTGVIGPYDFKPSLLGEFIVRLVCGKLPGLVRGGFNWVDVRDVAAGALAAERKGKRGERYIFGGSWESVEGLSRIIGKIIRRKTIERVIPLCLAHLGLPFLALAAHIAGTRQLYTRDSLHTLSRYRSISLHKAETELGYTHRPLEETLADTIAWFMENGFCPAPGVER